MEDVKTEQVTEQENQAVDTTNTETKEVVEESTPKTYSEDEYKKACQSSASKAKYEILQELGIKNVDDYKAKVGEYEKAIADTKSLKESVTKYESQIKELNETLTLNRLHVSEDFKDDVLTLARAKVTEDVSFEDAVKAVIDKNPNWTTITDTVKIGTAKSSIDKVEEEESARRQAILRRAGI